MEASLSAHADADMECIARCARRSNFSSGVMSNGPALTRQCSVALKKPPADLCSPVVVAAFGRDTEQKHETSRHSHYSS
jgi:hypothetical protein